MKSAEHVLVILGVKYSLCQKGLVVERPVIVTQALILCISIMHSSRYQNSALTHFVSDATNSTSASHF